MVYGGVSDFVVFLQAVGRGNGVKNSGLSRREGRATRHDTLRDNRLKPPIRRLSFFLVTEMPDFYFALFLFPLHIRIDLLSFSHI